MKASFLSSEREGGREGGGTWSFDTKIHILRKQLLLKVTCRDKIVLVFWKNTHILEPENSLHSKLYYGVKEFSWGPAFQTSDVLRVAAWCSGPGC